jgi:lysophospholipase L1-like esterase
MISRLPRCAGRALFVLVSMLSGQAVRASSVLTILPLGDSITYGYQGSALPADPGGYRGTLYTDLTAKGYNVQLVGSETANPPTNLPATADGQEGHPSYVIADAKGTSLAGSLADNIDTWLGPNGPKPDVVLLMIGVNNILERYHLEQGPYELGALVRRINELDPGAKILVSTLLPVNLPQFSQYPLNQDIQRFNQALEGPDGVIASLQKSGIQAGLVDIGSLFTASDLADGLHPNVEGYVKLGHAWASAVEGLGGPGGAPEPLPVVTLGVGMVGVWLRRGRRARS